MSEATVNQDYTPLFEQTRKLQDATAKLKAVTERGTSLWHIVNNLLSVILSAADMVKEGETDEEVLGYWTSGIGNLDLYLRMLEYPEFSKLEKTEKGFCPDIVFSVAENYVNQSALRLGFE